jgi:hypothetical protein
MYAILAREAPRAVIFRRGPNRRVLLLSWDLETDAIVPGQWFKGRIYERRCDLSPDGRLLIYFAAKFWRQPEAWTAISKPPYFTALALWMKETAWGGGGLFDSATSIGLNHHHDEFQLADGFALPPSFDVHPLAPERYTLQSSITGIGERQGAFYRMEHFVGDSHPIGRSDWADWAPNGDLLFTRGCSIYRLPYANGELAPLAEAREIADLADATFTELPAPPEARQWF